MLTLKNKTATLIEEVVKENFGAGLLEASQIFDMLEYPEVIAKVTHEDVEKRLKDGFSEDAFVLSTVLPLK